MGNPPRTTLKGFQLISNNYYNMTKVIGIGESSSEVCRMLGCLKCKIRQLHFYLQRPLMYIPQILKIIDSLELATVSLNY